MKRYLPLWLALVVVACGVGAANAANPMAEKEATPTIKERITKDTIKGTLLKMDGEYFTIRENDGTVIRIHVDRSTKMDKVAVGDQVKAYITDEGHTTTLQRNN
ncbi:MAG TPA: hypothetical protein PKA61_14440 [Nitrospira sp.]|nr:hypothetical protein [Nitrospira sp.]